MPTLVSTDACLPFLAVTEKELKSLIAQGESQTLEFKQTISDAQKIAKTLAAFANTRGGILLVGVKDNRQIIGTDPQEEVHLLEEASTFFCSPPLQLRYKEVETETGKNVLMVYVFESGQKPHMALSGKDEWLPYVRLRDQSVISSKQSLRMALEAEAETPTKPRIKRKITLPEASLIDYLIRHRKITLKAYAKLVNFSERRAKRTLTDLAREGVIRLHTYEKEPFYTLA